MGGNGDAVIPRRNLCPCAGIGQPEGQPELCPQDFVDAAHDEVHHRARGVEDATLHPLLRIVFLQEQFVEVDDRVFLGVAVAEVAQDRLHVGLVQHVDHVAHAEFVEVEAPPLVAPADLEEVAEQFLQEGVSLGTMSARLSAMMPMGREIRAASMP